MTHLHPQMRGWEPRVPTSLQSIAQSPSLHSGEILRLMAEKRAQIAALEADWTAEAEKTAARSLGRAYALGSRETWDRTTWNRYLTAAERCEHRYLPRLRRLYADVEALQTGVLERTAEPMRRVACFARLIVVHGGKQTDRFPEWSSRNMDISCQNERYSVANATSQNPRNRLEFPGLLREFLLKSDIIAELRAKQKAIADERAELLARAEGMAREIAILERAIAIFDPTQKAVDLAASPEVPADFGKPNSKAQASFRNHEFF